MSPKKESDMLLWFSTVKLISSCSIMKEPTLPCNVHWKNKPSLIFHVAFKGVHTLTCYFTLICRLRNPGCWRRTIDVASRYYTIHWRQIWCLWLAWTLSFDIFCEYHAKSWPLPHKWETLIDMEQLGICENLRRDGYLPNNCWLREILVGYRNGISECIHNEKQYSSVENIYTIVSGKPK